MKITKESNQVHIQLTEEETWLLSSVSEFISREQTKKELLKDRVSNEEYNLLKELSVQLDAQDLNI